MFFRFMENVWILSRLKQLTEEKKPNGFEINEFLSWFHMNEKHLPKILVSVLENSTKNSKPFIDFTPKA